MILLYYSFLAFLRRLWTHLFTWIGPRCADHDALAASRSRQEFVAHLDVVNTLDEWFRFIEISQV